MGILSRLRKTFRGEQHNAEIEEELQFHLAMDAADGHDARQTRLRLGNSTLIAEDTRSMGIVGWLDCVLQDTRYGLRQLRKTPALVAAIVLSLAIGVGANTAIFSLVDAAILKPLPVADPDALRVIEWTAPSFPEGVGNVNGKFNQIKDHVQASSISAALYRRLASQQTAFAALVAAADGDAVAITADNMAAEQLNIQYVSCNFFLGLGVPVQGRPFMESEDRVGQEPVVIVSHRFWTEHLDDGKPLANRFVRINNVPARVIGVAPAHFFGTQAGQWVDVYAPLAARVVLQPGFSPPGQRGESDGDWWVRQIARLKPDVPEATAVAQTSRLFHDLALAEGHRTDPNKIPQLISLPGRQGFEQLRKKDSDALKILMLLVGVLLLIVCANVANLLLSRTVSRQRESAIRLALGASRARLFQQHLIESGVLSVLGAAAGLELGYLLAQGIHLLFQTGRDSSSAYDLHIDLRVMAFSGTLAIVTAFLFGLAPALRAARATVGDALKTQTRSVVGGRLMLPRVLVAFQIALSISALIAAGLLTKSLGNLKWIDIGFDRENLAYVSLKPTQIGYTPEQSKQFAERVTGALRTIPGVVSVSPVGVRLLSGNGNVSRVNLPGRNTDVKMGVIREEDAVQRNSGGEDFFETLRIPLIAGRKMGPRDHRTDSEGVVVDEFFARRFFPNQNPLGRRFGLTPKDSQHFEIVGVAGNTRYNNLREYTLPTVYELHQARGTLHFAIRSKIDSEALADSVRKKIAAIDPAVPVTEFHTQTGLIDRMLRTERLLGFVSTAFGVIALTLAAIGLGGLLNYAVSRRTNEIGVRMALGAAAGDVIKMVLKDWSWMVFLGLLLGVPGAIAIGRLLKSALFGLQPFDVRTATIATTVLLVVSAIAVFVPARRAARVDPMAALREE